MFNPLKKKKPALVVATLNARLQPLDRGAIEDALEDAMARQGYGVRVVGGGTLLSSNGEVCQCDIEIELDDPSDAAIKSVIGTLEAMLAPKGSHLFIPEQNRDLAFGAKEGLGLYLNGTDLPDEAYQNCDVNHVFAECQRLLGDIGTVSSHWRGSQETALYIYGTSFAAMREQLIPFLQSYPLCQQCRVEQIA